MVVSKFWLSPIIFIHEAFKALNFEYCVSKNCKLFFLQIHQQSRNPGQTIAKLFKDLL